MSTSRTARLKFNYYVTKNDTKLGGNVMNDKKLSGNEIGFEDVINEDINSKAASG